MAAASAVVNPASRARAASAQVRVPYLLGLTGWSAKASVSPWQRWKVGSGRSS